jgi:ribonuclease HI
MQKYRKELKIKNYMMWQVIHQTIESKSLIVEIKKVKAHSNNIYNDKVDSLAKQGAEEWKTFISINTSIINKLHAKIVWDNKHIIEQDSRK